MKIAITSTGNTMDSTIDQHFGRCAWFVFYDDISKNVEFIPNTAKEAREGAGIAAVELVASKEAHKIVSGEFGFKIKSLLDNLKIQMIMLHQPERKIGEIIDMLGSGRELAEAI
jgi:predicted Fe-Mo cluster-binding NifX family protein